MVVFKNIDKIFDFNSPPLSPATIDRPIEPSPIASIPRGHPGSNHFAPTFQRMRLCVAERHSNVARQVFLIASNNNI